MRSLPIEPSLLRLRLRGMLLVSLFAGVPWSRGPASTSAAAAVSVPVPPVIPVPVSVSAVPVIATTVASVSSVVISVTPSVVTSIAVPITSRVPVPPTISSSVSRRWSIPVSSSSSTTTTTSQTRHAACSLHLAALKPVLMFEVLSEITGRLTDVHEVAVPATTAGTLIELATSRFAKVSDRGVLAGKRAAGIVTTEQTAEGFFRVLLVTEFDIDIAHHMVTKVLTNLHIFNRAKGLQLIKNFLIEIVELFLNLVFIKLRRVASHHGYRGERILPHVLDDNRLAEWGSVVLSRAPIAVSTCTNFKVKRAIYLILFCAMNTS